MSGILDSAMYDYKLRAGESISAPTVEADVHGTTGSTSYSYVATFTTNVGETIQSSVTTVTNGNATLTANNFIRLSCESVSAAARSIKFFRKHTDNEYYLIGTSTPSANVLDDTGLSLDLGEEPPTTNTSGRDNWQALLWNNGKYWQRPEGMDQQWLHMRDTKNLGDTTFRNGDIREGCKPVPYARGTVLTATVTAGNAGTGYEVGDTLTIYSTEGSGAIATVATLSGTAVATLTVTTAGSGYYDGTGLTTTSAGGGTGCKVDITASWKYTFTEGVIYLDGQFVTVPEALVTLTGFGEEVVGITVTPTVQTYLDDDYIRNIDELIDHRYEQTGADRLVYVYTYVLDTVGSIEIQRFVDGIEKTTTLPMERTELQKRIAEGIYDVSGHFVTENFSYQIVDHEDDAEKLQLKIGRGVAYPKGFKVQFDGTRFIEFNKARVTASENESACDVFDYDGGVCTGTIAQTYSLNGKTLKFKVGSGDFHEVAFTSESTAAQVGAAIAAKIVSDGYPADLMTYVATTVLQLRAREGNSLTISAPTSNDAAPILGLAAGTYLPQGTRLYQLNHYYIKEVTDMSYKTESVVTMTRSNLHTYDEVEDLSSIIGISDSLTECHDEKFDYSVSVDYQRSVIEGAGPCIDWSLGGSQPIDGATYYAKIKKTYEPIIGTRRKVLVIDAPIIKGAEYGQDSLSFTSATSITRAAIDPATGEPYGTSVSLTGAAKDVISIVRINNSAGQSATQYTSYSLLKNSGALSHDTSQIDWSAAGEHGTGVTGQPISSATYYVTFYAWAHILEGDVVTAASYDSYTDIEMYGGLYLRDCLDFRTTGTMPGSGEDPGFDYEYYLGRIDKLTIDDFGNFRLITGAPALAPPAPPDQSGVLTLAVIHVPAYTYSISDVAVVSVEPKRITQRGIQRLQERIERLEYWNTVNDLEKEVSNKDLYGLVGGVATTAEKQGVFTDALTGFGKIDLNFSTGGLAHTAAIDRNERCIRLPASQDMQVIEVDLDNSVHVRQAGNSIMLDYQPEVFDEQTQAGITVNGASDFTYENYYGHMLITPEIDVFVDSAQLPQLNIDFDSNLQPLLDTINPTVVSEVDWGGWSNGLPRTTNWHQYAGVWSAPTWTGVFDTTRTGTQQVESLVPNKVTQEMGDRVVDFTLQGMMRSGVTIACDVIGLLPNVDHAVTMNGIACDLTYDSSPVNHSGAIGSHTYQSKTTVTSSNTGSLTATFLVPEGIPIGNAIIRVFYYADPDISTATANYYTAGFTQTNQNTVVGISSIEKVITTETVTETGQVIVQGDPLAQTFVVNNDLTYISELGLFFKTKSATMPYTVQIRNTVNGYPGPLVYASKTLTPDDIDVSTDSSIETRFVFDNVLGYNPGQEYCFVGIPSGGSTDFNLYSSELGTVDILTGQRIVVHTCEGVLFHGPNNRTWEPWTKRDLKYKLYKSNFENDCQIVWTELTGIQASILVMAVEEFIAPGTNVTWAYSLDSGVTWIPFHPYINTELDDIITKLQLRVDVTSLGGSYQIVDKFAGILLLYHNASASYIGNDSEFSDALSYPNKVSAFMDLDTDGTNGTGVRSVTPKFSVDDGVTWVELGLKEGYTPVALDDPWYSYQFETPDEASITNATNAEPIVITSAAHGYKEGAIVTIDSVGGNSNANGDWVVTNADTNTFELYTTAGVASVGNNAYTTGGTIVMKEFSQLRPLIYLETSNRALTPKVRNIGFIASRVE
jgi:hypothetical protein